MFVRTRLVKCALFGISLLSGKESQMTNEDKVEAVVFNTLTGKYEIVLVEQDVLAELKREDWREDKAEERLCRCRVEGHRCTKSDEECQKCHWYIVGKQNGGVDSLEFLEEELGLEPKADSNEMEIMLYSLLLEQLLSDVEDNLKFIAHQLFDGYTEQEIADVLGKSRNTVHSQIVRLRKMLQKRYQR